MKKSVNLGINNKQVINFKLSQLRVLVVINFIMYLQLQEKMLFFLSVEEEHIMVRTAIIYLNLNHNFIKVYGAAC